LSAGILKALRTGRLAAFVALDAMQGRLDTTQRYTRILRREHAAYLEERARFYSLEGRWRDTRSGGHAVPAMSNDTMKRQPLNQLEGAMLRPHEAHE
jgi:flavin-dependent dehydrogenase